MMREQLERAVGAGMLRPLDLHFALWMGRFAGSDDLALGLAAALASRRVGEGDVCLELERYAGLALLSGTEPLPCPELGQWRAALQRSSVVGGPGDAAPLILDGHDRLYLGRYWRFEQDLAGALLARAGSWAPGVDRARLRAGLERLFPPRSGTDWQKVAAALAVLRPFCVVSGGPGTGKTRTVTAILALLLEQATGQTLRIGLAAPTGKAAARLTESIRQARRELDLADGIEQAIPDEASTLHRLLGFRPGRARPAHGADNPLHLDALVVDEASMVDLPLMARLTAALRPDARLVLLGDKDQLASVEAGMVLGDICGRGREGGYSAELCRALTEVAGVEPEVADAPSIADQIAVLRESYRFGAHSGIGAAAQALNAGDGVAALAVLGSAEYPDATLEPGASSGLAAFVRERVIPGLLPYLDAATPAEALAAFNRFRVLCAVRGGPFGVIRLNALIEQELAGLGEIDRSRVGHYAGRPLMVTRNDYAQGLFNGDVGLILPDPFADGSLRAFFDTPEGLRRVLPTRLPAHETVFAMTVHKSQGSEFDEVVLVLPVAESRAVTRELLYTAITRAKRKVRVLGPPERIAEAARTPLRRSSGLYDALWDRP